MKRRLAFLSGASALALSACTIGEPLTEPAPETESAVEVVTVTETSSQPEATETSQPAGDTEALEFAVDRVVAAYGGRAAVSIGGEVSAGDATGFASWSTMKVPVAIAALKAHPELTVEAASAIQASDNGAADVLWRSTTPEAVEAVLAEGTSPVAVQRDVTRPGFSAFGQTQWSVAEQARFASHLQCVTGSAPVLELMGNITGGQAYGLGTIPGARFKGGWGPSISGAYEVRQFGLVPDGNGRMIPLAIAATPADGTYESGQAMLTQLTTELIPALDTAPGAVCA